MLYTVNPATGERGPAIGNTGGYELTGLAVDPTTGQLYGVTSECDEVGARGDRQDQQGPAAFVGYVFLDCDDTLNDITFTSTGQMFGWTKLCGGETAWSRSTRLPAEGRPWDHPESVATVSDWPRTPMTTRCG